MVTIQLFNVGPELLDSSGYGEANRSILLELHRLGVEVKAKTFSSRNEPINCPESDRALLMQMQTDTLEGTAPVLFVCPADMFRPLPGRRNLGLTMMEWDRLSSSWVSKCNQMDEVWVPSHFNYEIFLRDGVRPDKVRVIPLGVDPERFRPDVPPACLPLAKGRFVFLSCFELIPRKGCDLLLQAYLEEFQKDEPVCLVLKTFENCGRYDPTGKNVYKLIRSIKQKLGLPADGGALVVPLTTVLPAHFMPSLYTAADCYVTASRGEGWNLPVMEAMAAELPVIATNWSAHREYLSESNGYLIEIEGLEEIPNFFCPGAKWSVPRISSIRRLMRQVYGNPAQARARGKQARLDILGRFTWRHTALKILERLQNLA